MLIRTCIVFLFFAFFHLIGNAKNATVGGLQKGNILRDSLIAINKIEVNKPYQIVDYSVTYFASGKVKEFKLVSNFFTKELMQTIKNSKTGDRFYFEEIKAIGEKGVVYKLQAIMLTIQ